jgi:hypothetical protein
VNHLHDSLDKTAKKSGGLKDALGTLAKIGIGGVIAGGAALVGILGVSMKNAADEQKNVEKLDAALRANVKGYTGNTDAIESLISKREALAFSDDEQRNSLALLVTKYHDTAKAQDIVGVAMDVARLKGISLTDASLMVSKGMDGNAKVLKQLGIVLPKTATEQERMAAIQKKAAGQAAAYGKTAAGAQESFQIALDDVSEELGSALLPMLTDFFNFLRVNVLPIVLQVIHNIQKWVSENRPLIDQVTRFVHGVLSLFVSVLGGVLDALGKVFGMITGNKALMDFIWRMFGHIGDAVGVLVGALQQLFSWAGKAIDMLGNIHMPNISLPDWFPHFAAGGIVPGPIGAPQLVVAHGGEKVQRPGAQDRLTSSGGVTIQGVSEQDILDMIDRGLFFRLRRTPAGIGV